MDDVFPILEQYLADPATGWSIGTFGAIAEFHRDAQEPAETASGPGWMQVVTPRGAIRIDDHPEARLVPYETISKIPSAWSQGVMVCLPEADAGLAARPGVADLGPDADALLAADGHVRFDLGFGFPHIDACVRSADPDVVAALRAADGTAFRDLPGATLAAVKAADPVRVFASRLGRIEVAQAIPDSDGATPMGPHTHILPALLDRGRDQAANIPVPDGWTIALALYPPHPLRTAEGGLKAFDRAAFADFQALIADHAPPALATAKHKAWAFLDASAQPDAGAVPEGRHARIAFRVALRQWELLNGASPVSAAWRALCDPTRGDDAPEDIRPPHEADT